MEHQINPTKAGLVVGAFLAGLHIVWSLFVAFGVAQALLDFVFWAHMLSVAIVVNAFDASAAATLIIFTAILGYVYGYLFALIWNWLHKG